MKENKLISMVEFTQNNRPLKHTSLKVRNTLLFKICDYANFLKQPLNLSMFVPCEFVDGEWVVLGEPDDNDDKYGDNEDDFLKFESDVKRYQKAKDNVLFDDCNIIDNELWLNAQKIAKFAFKEWIFTESETIECLLKYNPTLTKNGLTQSGL
tara:strand:+ start:867 stop:1325 length:459 start_codon:yes stop_codon:yes gene_type:complete